MEKRRLWGAGDKTVTVGSLTKPLEPIRHNRQTTNSFATARQLGQIAREQAEDQGKQDSARQLSSDHGWHRVASKVQTS